MTQPHSPEPWAVSTARANAVPNGVIVDANGGFVSYPQDHNDVLRIVACVNACEGIPLAALQEFNNWSRAGVASAKTYRDQRDALLTVIRMFTSAWRETGQLIDTVEDLSLIEAAYDEAVLVMKDLTT